MKPKPQYQQLASGKEMGDMMQLKKRQTQQEADNLGPEGDNYTGDEEWGDGYEMAKGKTKWRINQNYNYFKGGK